MQMPATYEVTEVGPGSPSLEGTVYVAKCPQTFPLSLLSFPGGWFVSVPWALRGAVAAAFFALHPVT